MALALFLLVSIFGHLRFLQHFYVCHWKIALFYVINLYIVILYFFALFGSLLFGLYTIYLTGALIFIIILFQKKLIFISSVKVIKNLLWFAPLLLFVRAVPKDFKFTVFDELHLWAVNIKWLLIENRLQDISSVTIAINDGANQTYPPAQMLFQYYVVHNFQGLESNFLIAQIIFIFICLLALNGVFFQKYSLVSFLSFLVSFIALYLFGLPFDNILAEGFLAAQLTVCVALALKIEIGKKSAFLFGICLSVLTLIKPISFIFVILSLLILAIRFVFSHSTNQLILNPLLGLLIKIKEFWKEVSLLILLPLIIFLTWETRIRNLGVSNSVGLLSGFKMPNAETIKSVTAQYFQTMFGPLYGEDNLAGTSINVPPIVQYLNLSLFSIILLLAFTHVLLSFFQPKMLRREALFIFLSFLLFAVIYYISLLCIYLSTFGEVLALVRYSVPFLFCWAMVIFYLLTTMEANIKKILILVFPVMFLITPSSLVNDLRKIEPDYTKLQTRMSVEKIATKVMSVVSNNSRIYYIHQNTDGFEKTILSYLILPIDTNASCFSIGLPYSNSDMWTCNVDLEKTLKGYEYLVLGNTDKQFWNIGKYYLNSEAQQRSQGIYKINYESGRLSLNLLKD